MSPLYRDNGLSSEPFGPKIIRTMDKHWPLITQLKYDTLHQKYTMKYTTVSSSNFIWNSINSGVWLPLFPIQFFFYLSQSWLH